MKYLHNNKIYCDLLLSIVNQLPFSLITTGDILVTGASGLIGSAIVDLLLHLRMNKVINCRIIASGRNRERLSKRWNEQEWLQFADYYALLNGNGWETVKNVVLAASPASPDLFVRFPEDVIKANTTDIETILRCLQNRQNINAVYVSSSEVYGDALTPKGGHIEEQLGEIDTSEIRSCYAVSKRKAEEICKKHAAEGMNVKIVRPGHIYGPTATPEDRRVSSAWAYDAAKGKDIVMKSDGRQLRSYTHCLDCATAILTVMAKGKAGEAYNISNRDSIISIREMAEKLARAGGVEVKTELPSISERNAFNPMADSSLNAAKLESLGWKGLISADKGLASTVRILREMMD